MNAYTVMGRETFPTRTFVLTCLIASLWVNASEIFRYFVFVMPILRDTLSVVPNVAPMNIEVFLMWGVWDSILVTMAVFLYWLYAAQFGATGKTILISGTLSWLFFFVLFWVGMKNMGLARMNLLAIALPLAWFECVVTSAIAQRCFRRSST